MDNIFKVSVIIPVYNAAEFLGQGLDSLLNQTLHDIEIICVNDGSSDKSLEILKEYEKKDSRIKVIDQENQGAGAARNNGMAIAQGEYLSFLDADDFFEKNMLEESYMLHVLRMQKSVCLMRIFMTVRKKLIKSVHGHFENSIFQKTSHLQHVMKM